MVSKDGGTRLSLFLRSDGARFLLGYYHLAYDSLKYHSIDIVNLSLQPIQQYKCDRVCIKGPLVGNLKNEINKFYGKLGFKASFALILETNLLFLLY